MRKRGLLRLAFASALVSAIAFGGSAASGARTDNGPCTWGASSITASYVNGQLVQSQPVTTGCIP